MKVKVNYISSSEVLCRFGNKFFTQEQLDEIERA